MTKVVHLTSVHHPYDNRILYKECSTLANNGFKVVLIAPYTHDETVNGVQLRSVPIPARRLSRILFTTNKIYAQALKENGELYHIHDPELLPLVQLFRLKGKHVIFDMHENMPLALMTKPWIPRPLRSITKRFFAFIERIFLSKCAVIFAEHSYQKHYPWIIKHETILNTSIFQEVNRYASSKKRNSFTIGYIGRIAQQRGSLVILEALSCLAQRGNMVHFDCIGPFSSKQHQNEVTSLVDSLNLQGVRFYGWQQPETGLAILARCHVGLAVLQDHPNYVESYPTKIFEYMGLGLPVIASNFPLYKDIIEKNKCGLCVNPADPAEISNAIQWLLQHPEKANELGERGKLTVIKKFNWNLEEIKLIKFYNQLLADELTPSR